MRQAINSFCACLIEDRRNNIRATRREIQMRLIFSHGPIDDTRMIPLTGSRLALDEGFLLFAIAFTSDP